MPKPVRRWIPWLFFLSFVPLGAIFPYIVEELRGRQIDNIGLLLTLPALMSLFVGPLWGILADWLQDWGLIMRVAVCVATIGVLGLGFAPQWALLAMALYAFGRAPITPISDALALDALADEPERYGSIRLWGSVGYMAGVLGVGLLQFWIEGASAMWFGSASMMMLMGMVFFLPAPKRVKRQDFKAALGLLFTNGRLMLILLCSALHFSVHVANSSFMLTHVKMLGLDGLLVGISMSVGIVVEIGVMATADKLQSRFSPKKMFQIAAVIAVVRWIGMGVGTQWWVILLCQATHGLTFGLFWLSAIQLVSAHTPAETAATGQSLLSAAVGGIGAAAGVYIANWIVETMDTVTFYFVAAGVAMLVCVLTRWLK